MAALSLVVSTPGARAQAGGNGSIEGRVQNVATGTALNNARVAIKGTNRVEETDEAGHYVISGVPAGTTTLRVMFNGLDDQEVNVTVLPGQTVTQDFDMTNKALYGDNDTIKLNEFVVQSTRETNARAIAINEQRTASNITSVVSTDEFGTVVDRNPGEFLKMLPGVDVEYFANNIVGVSVRGLGSVNTEVNFDGMPVASANAEAAGRGFEIQYASAADISRVEVRKLPLPEDSANALGGSINLIRRSAFEATKRKITYRAVFQSDGEKFTLDKMDGPMDTLRDRWRPNWEIAWTEPINKNLGFAVTIGANDTIVNTHWSTFGWNLGGTGTNDATIAAKAAKDSGATFQTVPSIYYPALLTPLNHNAPKQQGKRYAGTRVDWRPFRTLTLGASLGFVDGWVINADDIRYSWNAANGGSGASTSFIGIDPSRGFNDYTTVGRAGAGETFHNNPLWRDVKAPSTTATFEAKWRKDRWTASLKTSFSEGTYKYYDTEHGFFNSTSVSSVNGLNGVPETGVGAGTANPIPITLTFRGADNYWAPTGITATASSAYTQNGNNYAAGDNVDWWKNSVARIGGARSRPGRATDIIAAAKSFVKYDFEFRNPASLQLGFDVSDHYKDRRYHSYAWKFVRADGLAGTADDSATLIGADVLPARRDSVYNYPAIERISMSTSTTCTKLIPAGSSTTKSVRLAWTSPRTPLTT